MTLFLGAMAAVGSAICYILQPNIGVSRQNSSLESFGSGPECKNRAGACSDGTRNEGVPFRVEDVSRVLRTSSREEAHVGRSVLEGASLKSGSEKQRSDYVSQEIQLALAILRCRTRLSILAKHCRRRTCRIRLCKRHWPQGEDEERPERGLYSASSWHPSYGLRCPVRGEERGGTDCGGATRCRIGASSGAVQRNWPRLSRARRLSHHHFQLFAFSVDFSRGTAALLETVGAWLILGKAVVAFGTRLHGDGEDDEGMVIPAM